MLSYLRVSCSSQGVAAGQQSSRERIHYFTVTGKRLPQSVKRRCNIRTTLCTQDTQQTGL